MTRDEMERVAEAHDSKAAKIRALNEAGATTSEISTLLGIRYQHTYNVLLRAGRIQRNQEPAERTPVVMLTVGADGSLVLPDSILDALQLKGGGQLFVRTSADGLLLVPRQVAVAEMQRIAAERMPEHSELLSTLLRE